MEPGFLVATGCRCDSHLLYRLVGVNVRIRRVNLTLLCWCPIFPDMKYYIYIYSWPIFPDMKKEPKIMHKCCIPKTSEEQQHAEHEGPKCITIKLVTLILSFTNFLLTYKKENAPLPPYSNL